MARVRRQNVFNTLWAVMKFTAFWILIILQLPIIVLLPPGYVSVRYMQVFMAFLLFFGGVKIKVHGKLSSHRPLLVVSNHISVFEIASFPAVFKGSFIAKKEMESWFLVGPVSKKFGVLFIDRRPSHAVEALKSVQQTLSEVKYPVVLFPEGTTTNGAYVKPFKSTLFNFVENSDVVVQPVVMYYRSHDGSPISDEDLAEHFAYFANAKQDTGPLCSRERSVFSQIFHVMVIGGFLIDIHILPPPDLTGKNRKEIADILHKIISDEYMKNKDKKSK